jgi:sugar/nucleoside kinase (ribokinase family)
VDDRRGIIAAGTWVFDLVKTIDVLPERGMLANVLAETRSTGGAPANVLIDLAKLGTGLPLYAAGLLGDDEEGRFIVRTLEENGIDVSSLRTSDRARTSHTDVMTESGSGARTFFHHRGVNAELDIEQLAGLGRPARIFHLGYLLMHDRLDAPEPGYGTRWGRLCEGLSAEGYKISVDVVSEQGDRFRRVVEPVLPRVDYLILNEVEASAVTGHRIRPRGKGIDPEALERSARSLMGLGVRSLVAVHFPEGGFALYRDGTARFEPSYVVPPGEMAGTVGAGDAFCAGMLYGVHESWEPGETLRFANACAAFCLKDLTASGGMRGLREVRRFMLEAPRNGELG